MATTENLERLEGLIKTLAPLATKQRGELIEAGQWNALVGGVLEVAKASLAGAVEETVLQHKHTDMVGLEWLTPKLRNLVSSGSLSDPASQGALSKLDRKLDRLATRMDDLADKFGRVQADLSGVQTKDIVRQNEVTVLGRKVDGVRDSRDDVAQLRTSLNTISVDVQTAVAAVSSLTTGGQLIDVAALAGRVDELDGLRDALTTPAGNILSAAEFERKLEELRAQLVTEDELRGSLDGLRDEFGRFDSSSILDEARAAGRNAVDAALVSFSAANSVELDRRFAAQETSVDDKVQAATTDLTNSILDDARRQWEPAFKDGLTGLQTTITNQEIMRDTATRNALNQDLVRVEGRVATQAAKAATDAVASALDEVQASLDTNERRLSKVEVQSASNDTQIGVNATNLAVSRRNFEAANAKLKQSLSEQIQDITKQLDTRVDGRIEVLRSGLKEDLARDLSSLGRDIEKRLSGTIRRVAVTEVGITSGRLRNQIASMVDTEVAFVRENINTRIEAGLATNAARVSGMVTNEVRLATADIDSRIERVVGAFQPEINRLVARLPGS